MKKLLFSALAGLVLVSACKKDNETVPTMQVSGTLSANKEVPVVTPTSSATGTFTGTYAPSTKVLNYTVTFSGLTSAATAAHLHFGDAKHSGPVTVPFTNVPAATSGTITGTATLTSQQADSLTAGRIYTNIHSAAPYTGGEIRANLTVK